jgi:kexin
MKVASLFGLAGLAGLASAAQAPGRNYDRSDYYVLHLDSDASPDDVAARLGLAHDGQLGELDDHHVFRAAKTQHDVVAPQLTERRRRRKRDLDFDVLDGVKLARKQEPRMHLHKRTIPPPPPGYVAPVFPRQPDPVGTQRLAQVMRDLSIFDPIFNEQWHLFNPVQLGHDVNVTQVWLDGVTGKNATVAIVDDGLDMFSNDLKDNYFAEGSWDYNDNDPQPKPELSDDRHGTRCAGEVSAVRNNVCGIGVAYDSKIAGIRILSKAITDADEAEAMIYKLDKNNIYSCSWGPPDDGKSMDAPGVLIRRAMLKGIQKGRQGLGSIYVFASGNGAASGDNCNFDGYTNSIYSITVGAVDRAGNHPYYSEKCSAQLVVTYSSGSGDSIHTTDVGENSCSSSHGGTSAAAPLAAGIFALVLEVRPDLTWRDFQYLAMETAAHVDDPQGEWQDTAIGKKFSHTFGYGKIDSYAIVERARSWTNVKPQAWYFSPWLHIKKAIPQGKDGLMVTFEVTEDMLKEANLARVEHVTVTMNVNHTRRGDLSVDLYSPENVVSHIATDRDGDDFKGGYDDWTFMSVVHWGEKGVGTWTLVVRDIHENTHSGTFVDWHLKLWGESIDEQKAILLPMPTEKDDDDHDVDVVLPSASGAAATTSISPSPKPSTSAEQSVPTDHPNRPTKPASEPSSSVDEEASGTNVAQEAPQPSASSEASESSWVSWLPTFGASKTVQAWIYGSIGLIVTFCIGLGVWYLIARRRRLRNNPRDNYEFELVDEQEAEGLAGGAEKATTGAQRSRRTRGGELYDAFAGGSDDEDFDGYKDRPSGRSPERDGAEADEYVVGEESDSDDSVDEKGETRPLGGGGAGSGSRR